MKISRLVVPAATAVLMTGGLAAPANAAPKEALHCPDYKSPDKVELSGDDSSVEVADGIQRVCLKAGAGIEYAFVDSAGYITSSGKGISYYIPVECPPEYVECGGGSGS